MLDAAYHGLLVLIVLPLAAFFWHRWFKELRGGVVRDKFGNAVARRKSQPVAYWLLSMFMLLLALCWTVSIVLIVLHSLV